MGLTAEVLKHAPAEFWDYLLSVYNDIFHHGTVPQSWCCTLFNMLPKKVRPTQVTDFRPIANIRLFYKVFACLVLETLTLNPHACRQPIWAQVRQVKPTLKCNKNNYGVSLTTTKHAEIIHQSTPQIRITSQYLPIAQMTITSVRNKFTRPTSPGATRATTSQRVPSKYPADPTFRWEICSIPPQFPIMLHTTAGPRFNVEKVCEPLDPVIPRMKDDMPIAGPINTRRRAHHRSKHFSKSYVHLV